MKTYAWMLALGLISAPLAACDRDDGPAEELGEELDDAADDIGDAAEDAAEELEDAADE